MTTIKQQPETKRTLAKLKDHPRQAEMFGDVAEAELEALVESMRAHGLQHPVEILPDGTVVAGHQRVRAAKRLGWKDIEVVVRHDLAAQGAAAVETHMVEDNFVRRHLTPLARAKCLRRLMELAVGEPARAFRYGQKEKLKTEVAARMQISLRSVNRYLLLLTASPDVQAAFDRGALTLSAAGKVALLPKADQDQVVQRLRAGEKPASVVREVTHSRTRSPGAEAGQAYGRLVKALGREVPKIIGRVALIAPQRVKTSAAAVRDAIQVLTAIVAAANRPEGSTRTPPPVTSIV